MFSLKSGPLEHPEKWPSGKQPGKQIAVFVKNDCGVATISAFPLRQCVKTARNGWCSLRAAVASAGRGKERKRPA
jgi:hypothetical protein